MAHHRLLGLLEALSDKEFEKFQWSLRYNSDGKVTKAQLDGVNRMTTVDVMIQTYKADGAVKITLSTLEEMQRNDLVGKHPDAGSGGGGVAELAKEPAAKNRKTATKQAPKKPTSTNKAPENKEAQPKEVKPRKGNSKKKMDLETAPEGPREPQHPKVLSATDKRGRKRKDPNAPKRPPSSFLLFYSERHPSVKEPGRSSVDCAQILGEIWRQLSQDDKQPYEKDAQELREKYHTDMVAYKISQGGDEDDDEEGDEDNDEEDDDAFLLFYSERHPSVKQPGLSSVDCAQILGEIWRQLSQHDKQPYEKEAQELREKYDTVFMIDI